MTQLTETAHTRVRAVLRAGDIAIDATVGNGHDTLFLATCVGPQGIVYGFDIQQSALNATSERIQTAGLHNVILFHRSHAELEAALPDSAKQRIRVVMFNLGYLPRGDKQLTTQAESTITAIHAGLDVLEAGGLISIVSYVGHPGGAEEATSVENLLKSLSPEKFRVQEELLSETRTAAPRLFLIEKR